jgi:O-6-methylguanine DNA methyltransferase
MCVHAAYAPYVGRIGREPAPMTAEYRSLISRRRVYVLESDSVIGVVVLHLAYPVLWIDNLAVPPTHQGRGLGRQLLEFAERHARDSGIDTLQLYTNALMTENIALYAHVGYQEFERRLQDGFRRVFMRKVLDVPFPQRVYALVRRVPRGRVITYGAIARLLGNPRAARQVGWAMAATPQATKSPRIPAHRVINARGELSGRHAFGAEDIQRRRLEAEGVEFDAEGRVELDRYLWLPSH